MTKPFLDFVQVVRQLVDIADARPAVSLGQVLEREVPMLRGLLEAVEAARAEAVPDLYQARPVWDNGAGDWVNVSAAEVAALSEEPYRSHHQVRGLFEQPFEVKPKKELTPEEMMLPNCLVTQAVDAEGRVIMDRMWSTGTPREDYEIMVQAAHAARQDKGVPLWRAVPEDEVPGAKRMREIMAEKFGDMAGVMHAVGAWRSVVERFHDSFAQPRVTNADLDAAERELLDRIRAEACWLYGASTKNTQEA